MSSMLQLQRVKLRKISCICICNRNSDQRGNDFSIADFCKATQVDEKDADRSDCVDTYRGIRAARRKEVGFAKTRTR